MYRKITIFLIFIVFFTLSCSKKTKYSDAVKAFENIIKAEENFAKEMNNAQVVDDAVAAIKNLNKKMMGFQKTMAALDKKYPELRNQSAPPKELKDVLTRFMESSKKMGSIIGNALTKFNKDPKLLNAFQELARTLQ